MERPEGKIVRLEVTTQDIEGALLRIPGIQAARIKTDDLGRPVEVHIVAGSEKSPKQVVRDVQTVSIANFGLEIDHRIISVVQFPTEEVTAPREIRPSVGEISTQTRGADCSVRVSLESGDKTWAGEASGPNSKDSMMRIGALAALNALSQMIPTRMTLELEHVALQKAGRIDVVVATVNLAQSGNVASLSGSAVISGLQAEAAVRAVLSAVNRRLWRDKS